MVTLNRELEQNIESHVSRDLDPSWWYVTWRLLASFLAGGAISLFFCSQFGIGFGEMAHHLPHKLHANSGPIQCAIVCGLVFSALPVAALRLVSSGLLFRKILKDFGAILFIQVMLAGAFMFRFSSFMNEAINILAWTASAYISFRLLGSVACMLSKQLRNRLRFSQI